MNIVGIVALVVLALLVIGFLFMFLRSIPDMARYRRIRHM
ncbi:MAG: hypothetical protein QOI10_4622 [Solirubrobacterales bacterium]|nr:hypothetical protein [Solirubrobacterales bacterium]MEA2702627.1 hypothetical protein [Actinomycetota bacterium]